MRLAALRGLPARRPDGINVEPRLTERCTLSQWYVFQHDGEHLGPCPTEVIADSMLTGKLPPDVWVAAPAGARWVRALDVPVIARLVEGVPTAAPGRDAALRLLRSAYATTERDVPLAVLMHDEDEIARLPDDTAPMPTMRFADDDAKTDPGLPELPEPAAPPRRRRSGA